MFPRIRPMLDGLVRDEHVIKFQAELARCRRRILVLVPTPCAAGGAGGLSSAPDACECSRLWGCSRAAVLAVSAAASPGREVKLMSWPLAQSKPKSGTGFEKQHQNVSQIHWGSWVVSKRRSKIWVHTRLDARWASDSCAACGRPDGHAARRLRISSIQDHQLSPFVAHRLYFRSIPISNAKPSSNHPHLI